MILLQSIYQTRVLAALLIASLCLVAFDNASADDPQSLPAVGPWMAVTHVFQGDEPQPAETHHVVFSNGIYYDFPSDPKQPWTIFDLPRSSVVLLDRERQMRTSVATEDLIRLSARAESEVTDPADRTRFGMDAQPTRVSENEFDVAYAETHYRVTAIRPDSPSVAAEYGRFVDWVCRLNVARPRGVPPFARMKLNAIMTDHHVMPRETVVTLTRHIGVDRTPAKIRLRSTTTIHDQITASINKQIKDTQSMRVLFQEIPWDQYEH
ncbi:hypothetical protein [Aporhodopirellula aestuarii]|uniref:Secreted protein n=1 Tax=Aporhodopirellula aestuarii TaxID=2950107 RepID=A0ABT0U4L4_9BACT|nr:hypothetical protein [Aporhodopirellula aestuarii]MCM2371291.1 hypothetical protein [Aporhodopirellula aestuarii]